ncbi:pleckstrin domain-containing protein [Cavenderia fasciculata]|uniref:Pleckstrin domain-containing protein n=1 Tax=Cavenderia fasciculata TaxID=261658 RepID=F4PM20_CACFS|nr:pleckstrin domain-containing protein [Cavenderia fasciculata]EGG22723.1 pleckstrin domain-containing protein [Cavenderia fasciculata]|eukprot:XP_004360574.1 pleckstrin domain-containing protein [Cavenderia fasciculata]
MNSSGDGVFKRPLPPPTTGGTSMFINNSQPPPSSPTSLRLKTSASPPTILSSSPSTSPFQPPTNTTTTTTTTNMNGTQTVGRGVSASGVAKQLRKMSINSTPSPLPPTNSQHPQPPHHSSPSPLTLSGERSLPTPPPPTSSTRPLPTPSPSYKKFVSSPSSPNLTGGSNSGDSTTGTSPHPSSPMIAKRFPLSSSPAPTPPPTNKRPPLSSPVQSFTPVSSSPSNHSPRTPVTFTNSPPLVSTNSNGNSGNTTPQPTTMGPPSTNNISKPTAKRPAPPALPPRNELNATQGGQMMIPKLRPIGAPLPKPMTANTTINAKRFLKQVIQETPADDNSSDEDDFSGVGDRPLSTKTNPVVSSVSGGASSSSSTASSPGMAGKNNNISNNNNNNNNNNSSTVGSGASSTTPSPSLTSTTTGTTTMTKEQSKMVQRNYLAQEMLSTEKKYINNLNRIMTIFVLPLRDKANAKDKILSTDEINSIFMNIDTIFGIHKTFLTDFETRIGKWTDQQKIGDVFLKMAPFLRAYTVYSNSYNSSILLLSALTKSNPTFQSFLAKCLLKPASKGLNLSAYLIMPIQRIPRYKLLLENLLSNSREDHIDYQDIKEAISVISSVACELDERLNQFQIKHKVLDIQNQLEGLDHDIVKPTRVFLKEGDLKKISDRVVNTRHFFLFNDLLIYAQKEKKNQYRYKHSFPLESCWVKDIPDTNRFQNLFQIISNNKTYFLCAPSSEDKLSWMRLLNEVINKLVDANPDAKDQRDSIYEKRGSMSPQEILKALDPMQVLPNEENENDLRKKSLWLKDKMTKECMLCTAGFTVTRRRHHCRKCGKIFCNDCCPVTDFTQYMPGKKARICKTCYEEISVQLSEMMIAAGEDPYGSTTTTTTTSNNTPSSLTSSYSSQSRQDDIIVESPTPTFSSSSSSTFSTLNLNNKCQSQYINSRKRCCNTTTNNNNTTTNNHKKSYIFNNSSNNSNRNTSINYLLNEMNNNSHQVHSFSSTSSSSTEGNNQDASLNDIKLFLESCLNKYSSNQDKELKEKQNELNQSIQNSPSLDHIEKTLRNLIQNDTSFIQLFLSVRDQFDKTQQQQPPTEQLINFDSVLQRLLKESLKENQLIALPIDPLFTHPSVIQQMLDNEQVHPYDRSNPREIFNRIRPGRLCLVLFHPQLPHLPLMSLYIALTNGIADNMNVGFVNNINQSNIDLLQVDSAMFYSISSLHRGLKHVDLGHILISKATEYLMINPGIQNFCTLSPIPNFKNYLKRKAQTNQDIKQLLETDINDNNIDQFRDVLETHCLNYLIKEKRKIKTLDPVCNFHLKNGASIYRLNWKGDLSNQRMRESFGLMINYLYLPLHKTQYSLNYKTSGHVETQKPFQSQLHQYNINNINNNSGEQH